jgi:hypothetical protein
LKEKVDAVLAKRATPEAGKWNNYDPKVTIQWFKRDGDNAMPTNKEGLLLHYRETHIHVVMWLPWSLITRRLLVPLPNLTPILLL